MKLPPILRLRVPLDDGRERKKVQDRTTHEVKKKVIVLAPGCLNGHQPFRAWCAIVW